MKLHLGRALDLYLLLEILFLASCDPATPILIDPAVSLAQYPLVRIASADKSVSWNDSTQFSFSQDFWLGIHEVTQEEFQTVMGYLPKIDESNRGAQLPVTNVSMIEAILFCNALSLRDGLDTIYQYTDLYRDGDLIYDLEGFEVNLKGHGYRLPLESEWIFAASGGESALYPWGNDSAVYPSYAWMSTNGEGLVHEGCLKKKTLGVCDLLGNVLEMVEGWYGEIPAGDLNNFAGSLNPNSMGERIVKGGSFRHGIKTSGWKNRQDFYSVNLSVAQEYLGFRVARGSIDDPTYDQELAAQHSARLNVKARKAEIEDFFGTRNVRLVAVNGISQKVETLNFNSAYVSWIEKPSSVTPCHPSISPDGKRVIFGTRSEGQTGQSNLWMYQSFSDDQEQPLELLGWQGAIPRWWIDPALGDTFVMAVSGAQANSDSMQWLQEQTFSYALDGGFKRVFAQGSFSGGFSSDGRWMVSAFTKLRVLDQTTGEIQTFFVSPQNGKNSEGSTQVCNASVKPGVDPQILFLDFGYPETSSLTGNSYGVHEFLFVMNATTGEVVDTLQVPSEWSAWEYPEWSNRSDYAVSVVSDEQGDQSALLAIRMSDHKKLLLATGESILTPMLWVGSPADDSSLPDSAGQYMMPRVVHTQVLGQQLTRYWERYENLTGVVLGSSRSFHGINPDGLNQGDFQNLALPFSGGLYSAMQMLEYPLHHSPQLNTVVWGFDIDLLSFSQQEDWISRFGTSWGAQYDINHMDDSITEEFKQNVVWYALEDEDPTYTDKGFMPRLVLYAPWEPSPFTPWIAHPHEADTVFVKIAECLHRLDSLQIRVLFVLMPQNTKDSPYYALYGPPQGLEQTYLDKLQELQHQYPRTVKILDLHQNGNHNLPLEYFSDTDHLLSQGSQWATAQIDSALKEWKK